MVKTAEYVDCLLSIGQKWASDAADRLKELQAFKDKYIGTAPPQFKPGDEVYVVRYGHLDDTWPKDLTDWYYAGKWKITEVRLTTADNPYWTGHYYWFEFPFEVGKRYVFATEDEARARAKELYDKDHPLCGKEWVRPVIRGQCGRPADHQGACHS